MSANRSRGSRKGDGEVARSRGSRKGDGEVTRSRGPRKGDGEVTRSRGSRKGDGDGRFIVYGRNPVREALRGRRAQAVRKVWATESTTKEPWLANGAAEIVDSDRLTSLCGSSAHQGICADAGPYLYVDPSDLLRVGEPLLVVLDHVQDPQNLGSICRTAECVGADGLVIHERGSAEVTPAACKASAGAVEHLRVAKVRNIADFLADARRAGCWCYGAVAPGREAERGQIFAESNRGDRDLGRKIVSYQVPHYRGGVALVLGSEGSGLRKRVASSCDELIFLPMKGQTESLGVSAAASAILYRVLEDRQGGCEA